MSNTEQSGNEIDANLMTQRWNSTMSSNREKTSHVDEMRLKTAGTALFELGVDELRHIIRCEVCLSSLWDYEIYSDRTGSPSTGFAASSKNLRRALQLRSLTPVGK